MRLSLWLLPGVLPGAMSLAACGGDAFTAAEGGVSAPDGGGNVTPEAGEAGSKSRDSGKGDHGGDSGATDSGVMSGDSGAVDVSAPDGCTPVAYYRDADGDGYGGKETMMACPGALGGGWVMQPGDCDDGNADVHPSQTMYFTMGYTPPGATQASFDYNCDGQETESTVNPRLNCRLENGNCVGSGYVEASPARSGSGVDPHCGSETTQQCMLVTVCSAVQSMTAPAIACR